MGVQVTTKKKKKNCDPMRALCMGITYARLWAHLGMGLGDSKILMASTCLPDLGPPDHHNFLINGP